MEANDGPHQPLAWGTCRLHPVNMFALFKFLHKQKVSQLLPLLLLGSAESSSGCSANRGHRR
jgi:hypothetical protein